MTLLIDNASGDIVGVAINGNGAAGNIVCAATNFGTATVSIEMKSPHIDTWVAISIAGAPLTFTANDIVHILKIDDNEQIRATVTGSTGAESGIYVELNR